MMALDEDMQGFKDDLDSIRSSGSSSGSSGESSSDSKSTDRGTVGRGDMIDLGLGGGDDDTEDSPWLANFKKVVYMVVGLAMFQAVVGPIPIPDATLLYVFAFGFLVLGLWAGATKHEELAAAWERVQERRDG